MPLLTDALVRKAARQTEQKLQKSARTVLTESASAIGRFDISLSHSIRDAEVVLGARSIIEGFGYSVYVDWLTDPQFRREYVSPDTAENLRWRMRQCDTLLYLATDASTQSRWMPWELGYFDGYTEGRVAILPVAQDQKDRYRGLEYLGVYPYIDISSIQDKDALALWVNKGRKKYAHFDEWRKDGSRVIMKCGKKVNAILKERSNIPSYLSM
jgi:hypothetical protein